MKRPSFQFYPGDWLNDAGLRLCSLGARGLWIEMICLMHQGSNYGSLKVNHAPILPLNLARISGATIAEVDGWLLELEGAGVFSRDEDGCIFSRRMIADEKVRAARAAGGILGGNPNLLKAAKGSSKVADKVNHPANLEPTPSSSSSSSSSKKNTPAMPAPDGVSDSVWQDFLKIRKAKKAPMTPTALEGIEREAVKAGMTLADALAMCCTRGWQGFEAKWLETRTTGYQAPDPHATVPSRQGIDPALAKIMADDLKATKPSDAQRAKFAELSKPQGATQ